MIPNMNYQNLKESYLFYNIAQKTKAYLEAHPGAHLYRMGIGDVSLPLCDAVIQKLHEAVEDQAHKTTFHGYMPECGDTELRTTIAADVIYICSPNNPTGAVFDREALQAWVDYANKMNAIILFDAAYEAFIEEDDIPHSIFEIPEARTCAIEICSLSKTAGFTGTRCGYTVIPKELFRGGMSLNQMWVRNRTTKTNGVSYLIQKGASAVFTEEGQRQIREGIQIYKKNGRCLTEVLDRLGIWYCGGKNAPYIWMKCPNGMGSWEFFDYLLNEIQVVGTPGEGFGACGEGYFRFSTFGSPEDTKEAAGRLELLLQKLL